MRALAADPEQLELSYEAWLAVFERGLRLLGETGVVVERVEIEAKQLQAWCQSVGRPLDSAARAEFAAATLRRRYRSASDEASSEQPPNDS